MGRTTVAKVGAKYCPIADKSDKEGINKYWARNVSYYMKRIINDTAYKITSQLPYTANHKLNRLVKLTDSTTTTPFITPP